MKKFFLLFFIIFIFIICGIRYFSLKNYYNLVNTHNTEVKSKLEKFNQESLLFSKRQLFYNSKSTNTNFEKKDKIPLTYESSNFDIDLMPIIISGKIMIAQTHSIKILSNNCVYKYKCAEQIKSITYPKKDKSDLIFYMIKFNSSKIVGKVPQNEREWLLQEIIFSEGNFQEKTICKIELPSDYVVEQLKSEVSFFTYRENIITIVLTDSNKKTSIFQISDDGHIVNKMFDGSIIIPNQFSTKNIWYINKDKQNRTWLMNNKQRIYEINDFVSQGYFIKDSVIQFIYWDFSEVGKFDFVNGKHGPIYYSDLFNINESDIINSYYKEIEKKNFFINDKINQDNILVIF